VNSFKKIVGLVAATAASLTVANSANAAIQFTFDATDSNIGAGIYAFDLSGVPTLPTYNSDFSLQYWNLLSPSPGNTLNPVEDFAAPSGWNASNNSEGTALWYFENTSGAYNGTFEVKATPNLYGTLDWTLAVSGISADDASGTVTIAAVPEPAEYGAFCGLVGLVFATVASFRRFKLHTPFAA
jgi:hypothetical protein